jgi:hypothetical protein
MKKFKRPCKQPKDCFKKGIQVLVKRWNKCIERNGDYVYVEK